MESGRNLKENVSNTYRKRSRKPKKGIFFFKKVMKFIKKEPLKAIAIIAGCILIYLTILFFVYENDHKTIQTYQQNPQ